MVSIVNSRLRFLKFLNSDVCQKLFFRRYHAAVALPLISFIVLTQFMFTTLVQVRDRALFVRLYGEIIPEL